MFTQRHFNHIAWELANVRPPRDTRPLEYQQWIKDVGAMADLFAETSPRFQRERFIDACIDWTAAISNGQRVFK